MHPGLDRLTPRERDALRLLAQGFDAKSAAARLGMSVHTLNDRLRSARQKLEVSSSREAARLFARIDREPPPPEFLAPEQIAMADPLENPVYAPRPASRVTGARRLLIPAGAAIMLFLILSTAAFWLSTNEDPPAPDTPPRVVSTSPRASATIAAGPFDLSVTFDRPMVSDSYSFVQFSADTYPQCAPNPSASRDQRTFVLRCTAVAGRHYRIGFNDPRYTNFRSTNGISATPYRLSFSVR